MDPLCGEVEDVVGALTPVVGGVAQVFHELLVELQLLLVAEVEEGEEEDRQEEGWEVESGENQREERTTMYGMWMTVTRRKELEPNVSVMNCAQESETLRAFSGCTCGCACREAPRNRRCAVCACHPRRHWCSYRCAFRPIYGCPLCPPNSHTVVVHPTLFRSHFSHVFTVFSRHFRCGIYTSRRLQ